MSESILVAFEKMHTLRSEQAFLSFLFGISVRILSNQRRKKKVVTFQDESLIQKVEDNRNRPDEDADVYFLHQVLALLPVVQKESLILFEIAGFNIREIAEIQQASESAVKQRLKRGRQKLTEILHNEFNTKTKEVTHGEA
jgi:RNA polymerase sigma-70 factor (ECF subfamily)